MKRVLKYADLVLLRVIPTLFMLYALYSSVSHLLFFAHLSQANSFLIFILYLSNDLSPIMSDLCLVLLGFVSILKFFGKTVKLPTVFRYSAGAMAALYVVFIIVYRICYNQLYMPTPQFFDFSVLRWINIDYLLYLLMAVCCFLKDKFFKIKLVLAAVCVILFTIINVPSVLYLAIRFNDVNIRLWLNTLLIVFCYAAVILRSLPPFKDKAKTAVPEIASTESAPAESVTHESASTETAD